MSVPTCDRGTSRHPRSAGHQSQAGRPVVVKPAAPAPTPGRQRGRRRRDRSSSSVSAPTTVVRPAGKHCAGRGSDVALHIRAADPAGPPVEEERSDVNPWRRRRHGRRARVNRPALVAVGIDGEEVGVNHSATATRSARRRHDEHRAQREQGRREGRGGDPTPPASAAVVGAQREGEPGRRRDAGRDLRERGRVVKCRSRFSPTDRREREREQRERHDDRRRAGDCNGHVDRSPAGSRSVRGQSRSAAQATSWRRSDTTAAHAPGRQLDRTICSRAMPSVRSRSESTNQRSRFRCTTCAAATDAAPNASTAIETSTMSIGWSASFVAYRSWLRADWSVSPRSPIAGARSRRASNRGARSTLLAAYATTARCSSKNARENTHSSRIEV